MKCKNCGGDLRLDNNAYICESCNATFALNSVYENIDVFICYIENDEFGRRTKDSIIAQEVYGKLEKNKISTFYERISANNMVGEDLELCRSVAMNSAKIILVVGTSINNFKTVEEKFSEQLKDKTIIPFCIDMNPGDIPKTFCKIQAVNFSVIGWEKNLVSGIYNLLGKENEVDTNKLFGASRKKKIIIASIVAAILVIVTTLLVIFLSPGKSNASQDDQMSTQQIYDQAISLVDNGSYIEALNLLEQIPEYTGAENLLKKIYGKYEGYYENDTVNLYLDVIDNSQAKVSVIAQLGNYKINTTLQADLVGGKISYDYVDAGNRTGKLELQINNSGISLILTPDDGDAIKVSFTFDQKSDQSIIKLNKQDLIQWIEKSYTLSQIRSIFYEVKEVTLPVDIRYVECPTYYIADINTYIFLYGTDETIQSVSAPASLIAPELIGETSLPVYANNILYVPNAYDCFCGSLTCKSFLYFEDRDEVVTNDTLIWVSDQSSHCIHAAEAKVLRLGNKDFNLGRNYWENWTYDLTECVIENQTHYLIGLQLNDDTTAWYQVEKSNFSTTFIRTGTELATYTSNQEYIWLNDYLDLAWKFPGAFGIDLNTEDGSQSLISHFAGKMEDMVMEKYSVDGIRNVLRAENNTHFLYAVGYEENQCAWYKASKKDGTIVFIKESSYRGYRISKTQWLSDFSDFAAEFPTVLTEFE